MSKNISTKTANIGIMSLEDYKKRTMAIARGNYKPKRNEPKIWFPSIKSLANVLSEENQALLRLIEEKEPQSVYELEQLTGRKSNNLLRTLRTMEQYGFVKLLKGKSHGGRPPLIPKVIYNAANVNMDFSSSPIENRG